jgi:Ca2+-binding RTX toxin-like protein
MANITLGAGAQAFRLQRNGQSDTIIDFRSSYFVSTLNEAQEVPPNANIAGIDGTGTGVLNFARTEFNFLLDINGINLNGGPALDDMTDMHIHGADVGVAGPIIFDFRNDAETVVNAAAGTVTGSWDTVEAVAQDMTAPDIAALLAGDTYFNIHTNRDTTGFIRGQILRNGTEGDLIDLTALNIGSFAALQAITGEAAGDAVITTFFNGVASTVTLDGVARAALLPGHFVFAGNAAQAIIGTANRDDLFGAGGNDTMNAGGGADRLFGEAGNDALAGGFGGDTLIGGLGADLLNGGLGADSMSGGVGNDVYHVDNAGDRVIEGAFAGIDTIVSTVSLALGANVERLTLIGASAINGSGNALNNTLRGNATSNVLVGGLGADVLLAGAGKDILVGAVGRDVSAGGAGADSFVFRTAAESGLGAARDVIQDFAAGIDKIVLAAIDADLLEAGNQAFVFVGANAFSGTAAELRFTGGLAAADLNGDGLADLEITVQNVAQLAATDFVL